MLIATAGHVDHGKTTLIRALTGVETDRLPEEKTRGLTIDLGFAYKRVDDNNILGFIDVPGHERFVRNMLAGVGAIDIALLVVAADDGVMPQTVEHLSILKLLGIREVAIVITRIDLVPQDTVDSVTQHLASLLNEAGWPDPVPTFAVNAPKGEGVPSLNDWLLDRARTHSPTATPNHFRLAVDRIFTVAGSGTVVTGAVFSGHVKTGDELTVLPSGKRTRVRALHANGEATHAGHFGQRLSLNLTGVERSDLERGHWLVSNECLHMTDRVHVTFDVLATESRPVRHWTPVHVHSGSGSVTGRIALRGVRAIAPATKGAASLRLDHDTHLLHGDRVVVRDQSATRTIGGGVVVHPFALDRQDEEKLHTALDTADHKLALDQVLKCARDGFLYSEFKDGRNLSVTELDAAVKAVHAIVSSEGIIFSVEDVQQASQAIQEKLDSYHQQAPTEIGPDSSTLRRDVDLRRRPRLFHTVVDGLLRDGVITRDGARFKIAGFTPELETGAKALLQKIERVLTPEATQPPSLSALAESIKEDRLKLVERLEPLVQGGHIAKVAKNRYFHPDAINLLIDVASGLAGSSPRGVFDAKSFRDAAGIGRNVAIDVLEYLDRIGVTQRVGDTRSIRSYGSKDGQNPTR